MSVKVYMKSEEYGEEEFSYDNLWEALGGIYRLAEECICREREDKIVRRIELVAIDQ